MNKRAHIVLFALASALLGRGGSAAEVVPGDQPCIIHYQIVHFAADNPYDATCTLGQVMELLNANNPDCLPVRPMGFAQSTVEGLLADESAFNGVFAPYSPCVYIEGGEHDAGDLAQPFARIGKAVGDDGDNTLYFDIREHAPARFYKVRLR